MIDLDQIKRDIEANKIASDLFFKKSIYLENNPYGLDYEKCSLEDFMENIFGRDDNEDKRVCVYPFEETLCQEYRDWNEQVKNGAKKIIYQPDQNFKYNALWKGITNRGDGRGDDCKSYVITDDLSQVEKAFDYNHDMIIASPITYIGKKRLAKNARYLYALTFDLDGIGMDQVRDLLYQMKGDVIPTANIIVNSGNGFHLYYLLKKPVALFRNAVRTMQKLKKALTTKIWNKYTSTEEKVQLQGIWQGFRVPGSRTKRGEEVVAFINRDCPLYTVEDLASRVSHGRDKDIIQQKEWEILDSGKYTTDRLTKKKAKALYPEWYERVIVKGDKNIKKWNISRALYDWWLRVLRDPSSDVAVGHRYYCLYALSIYAIKCDVPADELKRDLYSLIEPFDRLSDSADNPFTKRDADDAFKAYKKQYCTYPRQSIENITGIKMPIRKRNGRKQSEHVKMMTLIRDQISFPNGDWREGNGRPKGSVVPAENSPQYAKVQEWRKKNPKSTNKSLCAREVKLDRKTVRKWWKAP